MGKQSIQDELADFYEVWDIDQMQKFIADVYPLLELFNADEVKDWVRDEVGAENEQNVRLVSAAILLSIIAEHHASKLAEIRVRFKKLYKRIEDVSV